MPQSAEPRDAWPRLWELFHAALEREPAHRAAFLADACGADPQLRQELEELLAAHETGGWMDRPPQLPGDALAHSTPPEPPGTRPELQPGALVNGRFRIVRRLGRGGMGVVYEAVDEELGVGVALKTLTPEISRRAEALERFRREVTLARRVTHPNVCRIFDLVRDEAAAGGAVFLSMELLHGETLADRLERTGPMSPAEALPLIEQVAAALKRPTAPASCTAI